ncbi:hypothetical protein CRYUN_Cryun39dG0044800 [Craigia yunnanensis]
MSYFHLRLSVWHPPSGHVPNTLLWSLSSVVDYMHCQPNKLQSNYHQFVVKKLCSSFSFRSSLSLQPVRALQTSMDTGKTFMFCKTCWSKDSTKSIETQNLNEEVQVYSCYSSQEYSNDEDHKEEQRRRKIGLANKGRVPWNKGRKHSAETRLRIKQRTIEALKDPKVRKKMTEHPRTHSDQSKARIGSSVRRVWDKRLKWKRLGEKFIISWLESIAETARKGGSDQPELEWDSYEKIKQEMAFEQLQWATEKAKGKEMAKVRAATAKAEKMARIAQKRKEQEEKEKARELKRKTQGKSKKDEKVADFQGLKLKQRLTMVRTLRKHKFRPPNLQQLCTNNYCHKCHSIKLDFLCG